ncbi:MAG: phosphoadenosine phosphosulfate reductase family protein [Peptococcaceae bacterium]|nr:phosphoadenosine phosphosulfate reductase family protein [Peptococcaceae bacterium]
MIDTESYRLHAKLPAYHRRVEQAKEIISGVLRHVKNPYIAFSCGKDSSVLAHLVLQQVPNAPLRFLSSGETRLVHNVDHVLDYFRTDGAIIQEINIDRVFSEEWKNATWDEQRKAGRHDLELLNDRSFDCIFMGLRAEESRQRKISLYQSQTEGLPYFCYRYVAGERRNMVRCCPLGRWTTMDVGAYIVEHGLPYLDWYDHQGFEGRTTARLTGDAVRQYALTWLKKNKPDSWNKLSQRFPEFRFYV